MIFGLDFVQQARALEKSLWRFLEKKPRPKGVVHKQPGGLGMAVSTSFVLGDTQALNDRDELYFPELVRLLSAQRNGCIVATSCDAVATLSVQKGP